MEYALVTLVDEKFHSRTKGLEEDRLWRESVLPLIRPVPENVLDICAFGFTEMVNNVIDHSESETVMVEVSTTAVMIDLLVKDSGVGIFNKIQRDHNLHDPRHALLELSKGKLTSDQETHSGEGIFFTSRMFDEFLIASGELNFCRFNKEEDWLLQVEETRHVQGTAIYMKIRRNATQTMQEINDRFAPQLAGGENPFSRTHVPLKLAIYEGEKLVSRSQAKRLLARVDKFREVWLDFSDVETIGQAFADEIFRVFAREHPTVDVIPIHVKPRIQGMISRVQFGEVPASMLEN